MRLTPPPAPPPPDPRSRGLSRQFSLPTPLNYAVGNPEYTRGIDVTNLTITSTAVFVMAAMSATCYILSPCCCCFSDLIVTFKGFLVFVFVLTLLYVI